MLLTIKVDNSGLRDKDGDEVEDTEVNITIDRDELKELIVEAVNEL